MKGVCLTRSWRVVRREERSRSVYFLGVVKSALCTEQVVD